MTVVGMGAVHQLIRPELARNYGHWLRKELCEVKETTQPLGLTHWLQESPFDETGWEIWPKCDLVWLARIQFYLLPFLLRCRSQ